MDQVKIGKFIAQCRNEKNITQEELGEKLGVTNKTTSRWENRHYLPDIEMMQLLSKEFSISINELISGEKIKDLDYKEKAEENLIVALENSTFTLKEKIEFHKKKWLKEHIFDIVLCIIAWLVVIVALKLQNAEGYLIGTISGILAVFFYVVRYNQMMIYVEDRVYKKNNSYYIEQPYNGIYQISGDEYNSIEKLVR